jgi:hypothetical protein
MSSPCEEERIVDDLAIIQKGKLRLNAHKTHWLRNEGEELPETLDRFFELLEAEVTELEEAIAHGPKHIKEECADIANIAAMIADLAAQTDSADPE